MDWMQSVQHALNYIEAHLLDEELDNDTVVKQIYSSSSNFQRIFSIVTGTTIADYIRCRKLTLAGKELVNCDVKVIDTALKYGYDSPESFTKAFVRFHGITPSEARNNSNCLKCFTPIFLRIEMSGGFNMSTKMIRNILPLINYGFGENYHFNGAMRYIMGCVGEMKLVDYSLFAGITGDCLTQFYVLNNPKGYSASDYYLGLRQLTSVFDKVGYAAEAFTVRELQSDREYFSQKIIASIDKGIPVIWYCREPTRVIVGYEENGNTFLYLAGEKTEPERLVLNDDFFQDDQADIRGFIVAERKKCDVLLNEIYRDAIINLPKLLTIKTDDYVFGAEAFRTWASDIENGKYDNIEPDDFYNNWFEPGGYACYVVNLSTNSGGCQAFLEKAQAMNPDFTFLEAVRKQYRITNYLWNGGNWATKDVHTPEEREEMKRLYGDYNLETLDGGFGCKLEALQDKQKRIPIVIQLRRFADCIDEVVRILNANLQ
jgi:AraC-like DNA-binding protein